MRASSARPYNPAPIGRYRWKIPPRPERAGLRNRASVRQSIYSPRVLAGSGGGTGAVFRGFLGGVRRSRRYTTSAAWATVGEWVTTMMH